MDNVEVSIKQHKFSQKKLLLRFLTVREHFEEKAQFRFFFKYFVKLPKQKSLVIPYDPAIRSIGVHSYMYNEGCVKKSAAIFCYFKYYASFCKIRRAS